MHKKMLVITAITVAFIISGTMVGTFYLSTDPVNRTNVKAERRPKEPAIETVDSRLLFVGEVFWGRGVQLWSDASELKTAYPFSGLHTFEREQYDAWFAHLECPSTETEVPISEQNSILRFNCRPSYLPEFAKWFDVVSLANNHTDNVNGQVGLDETRQHLETNSIQHYGHYDNAVKDELCEIIVVPTHIRLDNGNTQDAEFPIAMCGYHSVFKVPTSEELDVISDYSTRFFTIVTPQMGAEYQPAADKIKTDTYRAMIDRGADAVIATHPHWVQNSESYKGKLIMYSIGNFMFDQQRNAEVTRGVGVDMRLSVIPDSDTKAWLQLAGSCRDFKDSCLEQSNQKNLSKPKVKLMINLVASDDSGRLVKKGSPEVLTGILQRTNWETTKAELAY